MLKKLFKSHAGLLLFRLSTVYAALAVCRLMFFLYNRDAVGTLGPGEFWPLVKGSLLFDSASIVYAYGLFIVLSLLPFRFRGKPRYRRVLFWYFAGVTCVVLALNMTDAVYCHYTQTRITADDFIFAENDNNTRLFFRFVFDNWYLVLLWMGLSVLLPWIYKKAGEPSCPFEGTKFYYPVQVVVLAAFAVASVALVRGGGLGRDIRPVTMTNAMSYTTSPVRANMILSNPFCIIRTMGSSSFRVPEYYEPGELARIYTPYHYPDNRRADSIPSQKGKNIIIFVLESFSAEHSALLNPDLYPDGGGYTPFLDSLMSEGYYFTRAYANGRKSIEALPAIVASTPSFLKPFVLMPQALGQGEQLPLILGREGYRTMFFCGSPAGSMGFGAYANQSGFRDMFWKEEYDARFPGNSDYDGFWGIYDEPFIDYMGEVMDRSPRPFFSTIFTISSHHPFHLPDGVGEGLPEGTTKVHRPVAYTDRSVRRFFQKYGETDWFANSMFVFVADHVSSERFAPWSESTSERHHIITFFHTPDRSLRGRDENVFQQVDIMPTILGLTGYEKPYFSFGRDIFGESERFPAAFNYFSNYQVVTDSLTVLFNDEGILAAYGAGDREQRNNIADGDDPAQRALGDWMKAVIQQYYTHAAAREFTVPRK